MLIGYKNVQFYILVSNIFESDLAFVTGFLNEAQDTIKGNLHHQSQCLGILIGRQEKPRHKSIRACEGGHGSSCTEPPRVECVSSGQNLWIKGGLNLKQERTEQSITH